MRAVGIILCCLALASGVTWAYPENYACDKLGARVITDAELDSKRDPNILLSDAPVPKGEIAFARVRQRQVFTIDLGDERIFDRVDFGTDEPGTPRNARRIRIEVSLESFEGPYMPVFEKAGLGSFQTLRIPKVRARWVRFDLGEGSEGTLVHSLRMYKRYEHHRLAEVTRLLYERVKPDIPELERFYKSAESLDWASACATLRAYCAGMHPNKPRFAGSVPDAELDLSAAMALAAGDLDCAGIERKETVPIDWCSLRTADWIDSRTSLSRGDWIAVAANACSGAGDAKWARFLKSIFYDWIDGNPKPTVMSGDDYPTWRPSDAASRARVLISRFAKITADMNVDDELWANWLYSIWEHADYLKNDTFSVGESMASAAAAVMTTASEFPFFADQQVWIDCVQQNFQKGVARDVTSDGKIVDDAPEWILSAYSALVEAQAGLERAGRKIDPDVRDRIGKTQAFLAAITQPDGGMPAIGERIPGREVRSWMSEVRSDRIPAASDGPPALLAASNASVNFPLGGWCVMRGASDQEPTADARQLVMKASRGPHSHDDLLAVMAYAYGRELLVDMGRDMRTAAHNTLCIDGLDQPGLAGRIDRWFSNAGVDWAVASHHAHRDLTAIRDVVFVKPDYWVLRDELESEIEGVHACDQNWHFPADASLTDEASTKALHTNYPSGGNMLIAPADPEWLRSEAVADATTGAKSWRYRKGGAPPILIDSVLCPYAGPQTPVVSVKRLTPEGSPPGVMALKVTTMEGVDYVVASRKGPQWVSIPSEQLTVQAELVVIRTRNGRAVRVSGGGVRYVSVGGVTLFDQEQPAASIDQAL